MIKDKESFLTAFNILKKIKILKSELQLNRDDFDFVNSINEQNSYKFDFKEHSDLFISIGYIFITTLFYNSSSYEFSSFFMENLLLFMLGMFLCVLYIFSSTVLSYYFINYFIFFKNKILFKYYYKYINNNNKPSFIKFFNEIYYLSLKNKGKNYDLNNIILKFNQEELDFLKENNISILDENKIYTQLICFLDLNLLQKQNFNYNDFKENIDYLLKNISSEKNLTDTLDKFRLIESLNNNNNNNNLSTRDSTLIYNF